MKSCPTCNRTFEDTLTFCLIDGSILSAPHDLHATLPYSNAHSIEPLPTKIMTSNPKPVDTISASPLNQTTPPLTLTLMPETKQSKPLEKRMNKLSVVIGIAVFLVAVMGLVIALNRGSSRGKNNSAIKNSANNPELSANNKASNQTVTASPESTPSPTPSFDIMGTWVGIGYGTTPATLVIDKQEGNTFYGTHIEKRYQIAFTGNVDLGTREVTMRETRVLKGSNDWSLAVNTGYISSDGKSMKGKGKDKYRTYSWSFLKQ